MEKIDGSKWEKAWDIFSDLWKKDQKSVSNDTDYQSGDWGFFLILRRALKPDKPYSYDVHNAWKKVEKRIEVKKLIWAGTWKYAALFILAVGIALYFSFHSKPEPELLSITDSGSILPGGQKAELLLAGGKRIVLDSFVIPKKIEVAGIKLSQDQQNGKLRYQAFLPENNTTGALHKLSVPKGGEYSMFLADGSEVWINSESDLQFPVQFAADKREVWLKGEAFFKIAENPDCPFVVHVKGFDITVLGTTFNVSAYEEDAKWQTTLVKGKVQIADTKGVLILQPSDQYVLQPRTGKREVERVDTDLYTSWIDGKFYFSAYTFEEIVQKLERWYDFTMIYTNEAIRARRFSGAINKDRPLEEILCHLEGVSELRFNISGRNITVSAD